MKKCVLALVAGFVLIGVPALAQPRLFLGVIKDDRRHDTVEDIVKIAKCHEGWVDQAWKDSKLDKSRGKPEAGTSIYLRVANCMLSPEETAKAEATGRAMGQAAAEAIAKAEPEPSRKRVSPPPKKSESQPAPDKKTARNRSPADLKPDGNPDPNPDGEQKNPPNIPLGDRVFDFFWNKSFAGLLLGLLIGFLFGRTRPQQRGQVTSSRDPRTQNP